MTPLSRYVVETLVTLLAIVGLAIMVVYAARRGGAGRTAGPLTLVGKLVLDARRAVYLVRVVDLIYVVGASEAGLTKLGELPREALGAELLETAVPVPARSFREVLERLGVRRRPPAAAEPPRVERSAEGGRRDREDEHGP